MEVNATYSAVGASSISCKNNKKKLFFSLTNKSLFPGNEFNEVLYLNKKCNTTEILSSLKGHSNQTYVYYS